MAAADKHPEVTHEIDSAAASPTEVAGDDLDHSQVECSVPSNPFAD